MRNWPKDPKREYSRAIFLDRDGTLNVDTHYPHVASDMRLLPGVARGMALLAGLPAHLIVISNQGGIGMGLFTLEDMTSFNHAVREELEKAGGRLDAFYYCPHIEPKNLKGAAMSCNCSKPSPALLLEAAAEYKLDLHKSYMVGDKKSDIAAGTAAGCKTVLIGPGKADEIVPNAPQPTYGVSDFEEAVSVLLQHFAD